MDTTKNSRTSTSLKTFNFYHDSQSRTRKENHSPIGEFYHLEIDMEKYQHKSEKYKL